MVGRVYRPSAAPATGLPALTFGSVVDHLAAEDVAKIDLPQVPDDLARRAEIAWQCFDEAEVQGR